MKFTPLFTCFVILQVLTVFCLSEETTPREHRCQNESKAIFRSKRLASDEFAGLPTEDDVRTMEDDMRKAADALRSADNSAYGGGVWDMIGIGLVGLLKAVQGAINGACISISIKAGQTCGGLKNDTCGRLDALRESVAKLKEEAVLAIERNNNLLRWNATNVHLGLEMRQTAEVMEDIITINAQMMDLTDALNYDKHPISIEPNEILDESGKQLADYKFRIRMKPSDFVRKITKHLNDADIFKRVKDKIAFGIALGISMSSQCLPDLLDGMLGLDPSVIALKDRLLVTLHSADSNVTFGYQYATRRQFFANVTRGAASAILADAQSTGLSGFFDLFVDAAVGRKVIDVGLRDGNRVRVENGASPEFLRRLQKTKTLDKLVEVTKKMADIDFDKFITDASAKDPYEVLKDLEIHEIPSNPHGINLKVIKQMSSAFKNFQKFFTEVRKSLDIAAQRFQENTLSWNEVGYYGFRALEKLTKYTNLALCVLNIVTTAEGARQMRVKIDKAEIETNRAIKQIEDAHVKGEKLLQLQKLLHQGVNSDIKNMINFLAKPLKDIDQIPADFSVRVRRVQKYLGLFSAPSLIREISLDRARDLRLFLTSIRGLMQGFYRRLLRRKRAIQLATANVEVEEIKRQLEELGDRGTDIYHVLRLLAFSDEYHSATTYDSFPLACIRDGNIQSEADLRKWFEKHAVPLAPQKTKQLIKTLVDFWKATPDVIKSTLITSKLFCHSRYAFSHDDALRHEPCTREDTLAIIALDVLPYEPSYLGEDLSSHRPNHDCSM